LQRNDFFVAGMKSQQEGGGRILLGDNRSGGAVMLWPIGLWCVEFWNLTGLPCSYI
jgi:hypothetical protein